MGTSLQVAPVSMIPNMVRCNRVLFNRDLVMKMRKGRDIFVPGDCDSRVEELLSLLGWTVTVGRKSSSLTTTTTADEEEESNDGNDNNNDNEEEQLENMFAKIEINGEEKQNSQNSGNGGEEKNSVQDQKHEHNEIPVKTDDNNNSEKTDEETKEGKQKKEGEEGPNKDDD